MDTIPPQYDSFVNSLAHSIINSSGGLTKPSVGSIRTATKHPATLAKYTQIFFDELPCFEEFKKRGGYIKLICSGGDRLDWIVHL